LIAIHPSGLERVLCHFTAIPRRLPLGAYSFTEENLSIDVAEAVSKAKIPADDRRIQRYLRVTRLEGNMIIDHPECTPPPEDAVLWRFMPVSKFLSLLHARALYFGKASQMDDTYEFPPHPQFETWLVAMAERATKDDKIRIPDIPKWVKGEMKKFREEMFISCWHMNEHESASMWKDYSRNEDGVAVCSTLAKMRKAFSGTGGGRRVFVSKVNYIDFRTTSFRSRGKANNMVTPILYKRKSFESEQEVRLFWFDPDNLCHRVDYSAVLGVSFPVNLSDLISRVFVAPTAGRWLSDTIRATLARFDLENVPVVHSTLYESPLY
jgi:hypothetical protein